MRRLLHLGLTAKLIVTFAVAMAISCGKNDKSPGTEKTDQFETIRAHIQTWLSQTGTDTLIMPCSQLMETILDDWDNQKENYQIVSVRKPFDFYNVGHIPNAINVYWTDIVKAGPLFRFHPKKTLIIYCYYGHASMISCTILGLIGYRCHSLNFGMMDWNVDALVKAPWDGVADYKTETIVRESKESFPLPVVESEHVDAKIIVQEMARRYFGGEGSPVIAASDVKAIVDDWEQRKGEYQIIDVRSKADYEFGHIPYSINIPLAHVAEIENLRKLDPDQTIIVYCENGQSGEIAATVLNLLGYHAVDMIFGMMEWNKSLVDTLKQWDGAADYPVET
ncbi:MAG: rhodanese-like domain-containing protein [Candidatus Zixiibacteriota bacterium]|nr:MAG: rhodanese-like domain-containing protein [candidate division Zixibacteria bacterium]